MAATPADAEVWSASDPLGDAGLGDFTPDIARVKVNHSERKVYVRVRFHEFIGVQLKGHLDIQKRDAGPEFTWTVATEFAPYDTRLYRVDDWGSVFGAGVSAEQRACAGLRTKQISASPPLFFMEIPRRCLRIDGNLPGRVRVSIVAANPGGVTDWAPGRHAWGPWLTSG